MKRVLRHDESTHWVKQSCSGALNRLLVLSAWLLTSTGMNRTLEKAIILSVVTFDWQTVGQRDGIGGKPKQTCCEQTTLFTPGVFGIHSWSDQTKQRHVVHPTTQARIFGSSSCCLLRGMVLLGQVDGKLEKQRHADTASENMARRSDPCWIDMWVLASAWGGDRETCQWCQHTFEREREGTGRESQTYGSVRNCVERQTTHTEQFTHRNTRIHSGEPTLTSTEGVFPSYVRYSCWHRILGGGKNDRFFDASRFSLERFCLDVDKLMIWILIKEFYSICWPAATFCWPAAERYRKISFLPAGSLRREPTLSNIKY